MSQCRVISVNMSLCFICAWVSNINITLAENRVPSSKSDFCQVVFEDLETNDMNEEIVGEVSFDKTYKT